MTAPRHLENAPIKEALIDIQVTLPETLNVEHLNTQYDSFSADYPIQNAIHESRLGLNLGNAENVDTTIDHSISGFRYQSKNGAKVAQFRTNRFTFSQLEPYSTWEEMRDEARRLWNFYCLAASPEVITRVATRYINEMNIPFKEKTLDFDNYLTAGPQLPDNLQQGINSFLTRIVTPNQEINAVGIITQAMESAEPEYAPIVLDIDVFCSERLERDNDELWARLEQLRNFKNNIFFESITETTAELFS